MSSQLLDRGLDSSGVLYGMCFKWFKTKRTSEICFGLRFAEDALFGQELGVFMFKGVLEVGNSCILLETMF